MRVALKGSRVITVAIQGIARLARGVVFINLRASFKQLGRTWDSGARSWQHGVLAMVVGSRSHLKLGLHTLQVAVL